MVIIQSIFCTKKLFISKKLKSYRANYPYYIPSSKDVENQKRYFTNRASLYDINQFNELMIKVYTKNIKNQTKNKNDYVLFYIPLTKSLNDWIN